MSTEIYTICQIPKRLLVYLKKDPVLLEVFANTHEQYYDSMMIKVLYQLFDDYRQYDNVSLLPPWHPPFSKVQLNAWVKCFTQVLQDLDFDKNTSKRLTERIYNMLVYKAI